MKTRKRITVVIDAEFGVDPTDEWDRDRNAYSSDAAAHANILESIAAGSAVDPDYPTTHIELGGGDVVQGDLVSIDVADVPSTAEGPAAAGGTDRLAELYTDLCDVVERAWMHRPVTGHGGEPRHTSAYAREAANRILELVGAYGPIETTAGLNYDEDVDETLDAIEAADQLTEVIEDITGVNAGEHSDTNNPWKNALLAGRAYAQPCGGFEYGIRWIRSREMHREGMTHEQAVAFVDPDVWAGAPRPVHEVFVVVRRPRGPWQIAP